MAAYTYNALGWRVTETQGGTTDTLYFSSQWQVIEERGGSTVTDQEVWGITYVNNLILRDDNSTSGNLGISGSGWGRRTFVQEDADYNTTALVSESGTVEQRYTYLEYGVVTVLTASWGVTTDGYAFLNLYQGGRLGTFDRFV